MTIQVENIEDFPPLLLTGLITHRLLISINDGGDTNQEPDIIGVPGEVIFRANVDYVTTLDGQGRPVTLGKGPIRAVYNDEGYLCTSDPSGLYPMYEGVNLHAGDDPNASVQDYSWTATFNLKSVNGTLLKIPPATFMVPSGSEQDLSTLVKVPATPGWGLPQSELAARRAEAAAVTSAENSEAALDVVTRADAGEFDGDRITLGTVLTLAAGSPSKATLEGTSPNKILNLELSKGDPGGWTASTSVLTGDDLNIYRTPGLYRVGSSSVNPNSPFPGTAFTLEVIQLNGSDYVLQRATSGNGARQVKERNSSIAVWSSWSAFNSIRVGNTAGRAIYLWDDTANRDQLIFGDTGWRDIPPINGWTAAGLLIRRFNNVVSLKIFNLNPSAATNDIFYQPPSGFVRTHGAGALAFPKSQSELTILLMPSGGLSFTPRGTSNFGSGGYTEVQWTTVDFWPTVLPGTASGSVPNA